MIVQFSELSNHARVWVYQCAQKFDDAAKQKIENILVPSMSSWAAHGAELKGSYTFKANHYLIIGVEEDANMPSGCSIDASTRWIKQINTELGLDFLDRSLAVLENDKIKFYPIFQTKKLIESGVLNADCVIVDNQINTKLAFENSFFKSIIDTQFKRYFEMV